MKRKKPLRVLVACEFSGTVRDAFLKRGHDAWSCDILNGDGRGPHIRGDARKVLAWGWDLMIAHPPCTFLAVSGARWWKGRERQQQDAIDFVHELIAAPIERVAIENPIGALSKAVRKPDQIIQPWQFGHGETKATCLWLRNLPKLTPTKIVSGRDDRIHRVPPSPHRWAIRSLTYKGIADAMAKQWG